MEVALHDVKSFDPILSLLMQYSYTAKASLISHSQVSSTLSPARYKNHGTSKIESIPTSFGTYSAVAKPRNILKVYAYSYDNNTNKLALSESRETISSQNILCFRASVTFL